MPRELREVWAVRDTRGVVVAVAADESYGRGRMNDGDTIERIATVTPEALAVLAAAVESEEAHEAFMIELKKNQPYIVTASYVPAADRWNVARDALSEAVRAYRVRLATDAEGHGPYAAKGEGDAPL